MSETSELLSFCDAFFVALCDPDAGDSLYRMHAPDAVVRQSEGLGPAGGMDPALFAREHREANLRGSQALPVYRCIAVVHVDTAPSEAAETVIWLDAIETRTQRALSAALGLRTVERSLRVVWCTFAARPEPWSFRDGLLQSLADYPWMRVSEPFAARALVDASYLRLHCRDPVRLSALPGARFGCQMSTVCCKHDFEISLPPQAQVLIDELPWRFLKPELVGNTRLTRRSDGLLQLKALNETCRFLGTLGQCLVHQTLGRQPFSSCAVFPFSFAKTPEGIAVGLSPICGSTRLGLGPGLAEREDYLRERLVHIEPRQTDTFRLAPGLEVTWERFRDIEKVLCEILAANELPVRRRLYVGARLLESLAGGEPVSIGQWASEPPAAIDGDLREAIRGMLRRILDWDRAALRALPRAIPADLFEREVREPAVVVRILQNTLFCKTYSYPFDLTTAFNFLIVLYLLTLVMESASDGPLSEVMWRELGALGVHGLLKSVLHEGVPEGFRAVFGTADFGQWMLAA